MELKALLAHIDAKRAELDRQRPLSVAEAARLREYLDVEWTYNSNAIEGSTPTPASIAKGLSTTRWTCF